MEWLWRCSCWRSDVKDDEEEEICSTTASDTSLDVNSQQNSETMGQTASRISNFFTANRSPTPVSSDVNEHIDSTQQRSSSSSSSSSSLLIPVDSSPKYPLATPRSPLRRGFRRPSPPETSLKRPPSKRLKGDFQYLDFPVLNDDETITFIQNSKVMLIMKGIPGSGKTFLAKKLSEVYEGAVVCSADSFFIHNGEYEFDRDQLKDAHEFCQQRASHAAQENSHVIIIDNTNVRNWEMKFYLDIAKRHRYIPLVLEPQTPWAMDPCELALRNSHGISEKIIAQKVHTYQPVQPIYYGWFLNEVDSQKICLIGQQWLQQALSVDDFLQDFSENTQLLSVEEIINFFSRDSFVDGGDILHSTAKFTARGKAQGAMEYISSSVVKGAMGQCFQLHIIGFVITPRTLGARLKLTEDQLELWANNDNEDPPAYILEPAAPRKHVGMSDNPDSHPSMDQNDATTELLGNILKDVDCRPTCEEVDADLKDDRFHPVSGRGSRAHFTLACGPGIKPVNTGFDLINVVRCEQRTLIKETLIDSQLSDQKVETYTIPGGVLRTYGEGTWVIYPDKEIIVKSMFSAFY
ncbi:hypothetical protein OTU49_004843 [Cherax quadricarinatus]|uniref:2',3'-cyclic-nucleotide 3'-phosphodiesterase n=1 Tax=Cherax quadricarinatus TaxID=27406 RepID=A0AAW0X8P6_CHEQU